MAHPTLLLLRAAWFSLPLLIGPAAGGALAARSDAIGVTIAALAWTLWGSGLVALLVPRATTLTAIRLLAPGALVYAAWTLWQGNDAIWSGAALVGAAVTALSVAAPATADAFVDGSSYGTERRVSLRTPLALLLGPAPLAWAVAAAGSVTGPLIVAAGMPLLGAAATIVGFGLTTAAVRQLHQLSRRWLVFVPAGIVVHDPLTLSEPILFQRHLLARFGPAPSGTDALDATGGAHGLAFEVRASEPVSVGVRRGRADIETGDVAALLVTPARPDDALTAAAEHRLPVG